MTTRPRPPLHAAVAVLAVLTTACGDSGATGGEVPDAAPPSIDAAPPAPPCDEPSGAGVEHGANVTADETWRAADGPHVVTASIAVLGATLTLEPCAVVRLRPGVVVSVGGTEGAPAAAIVAHGASIENVAAPPTIREVRFERDDAAQPWGALRALPTGVLDLEHVHLSGAGDPETAPSGGGTLVVAGPGDYTGNAVDEIVVDGVSALADDVTFHARGVPYHLVSGLSMAPATTAAASGLSTLTLEAGVELRFDNAGPANAYGITLGASSGALSTESARSA